MLGVPASNLHGASLNTVPSKRTSLITSPPPVNGGIASSSSPRAHTAPVPGGPHLFWPGEAQKSKPHPRSGNGWWRESGVPDVEGSVGPHTYSIKTQNTTKKER